MKITVEFDLSTEEGKADFEDFKNMRRNARFWNELYDEVFRSVIKYRGGEESNIWRQIWEGIDEFRRGIE